MEQPIVIRFRWTADELLRAYDYHFRHTCRPVFRVALHVIFALMILAGYGLIRNGGATIALGIGFIVGGVYWFVFRRFERRWMVRRQFRKRPDRDIELEWQIAADIKGSVLTIDTQITGSIGVQQLNQSCENPTLHRKIWPCHIDKMKTSLDARCCR